MKTIIKKAMIRPLLAIFVLASFAACSDWTDTESLGIDKPTIENQNPELYARYLSELRNYKISNHPIVIGVFDNVEIPVSRASHLTCLPDSVDMVMLTTPDNLPAWLTNEMDVIRRDKGTKTIYAIDYADIEKCYKAKLEADANQPEPEPEPTSKHGTRAEDPAPEPEPEPEVDGFLAFCDHYMDSMLLVSTKYAYDGISVLYNGRSTINMTADEIAAYRARQESFVAKVSAWATANPQKTLLFDGTPQYLFDKSILLRANYIVVRAFSAASVDELVFKVSKTFAADVPTDRFVIGVTAVSLTDKADKRGFFNELVGEDEQLRAIVGAARWIVTPATGYVKSGMMIGKIMNDYYNQKLVYQYTREAIYTMSPSPKN